MSSGFPDEERMFSSRSPCYGEENEADGKLQELLNYLKTPEFKAFQEQQEKKKRENQSENEQKGKAPQLPNPSSQYAEIKKSRRGRIRAKKELKCQRLFDALRKAIELNSETDMEETSDDDTESIAEFMKGLPSYDIRNFSNFQPDKSFRRSVREIEVYIPTKDYPSEQIIVSVKYSHYVKFLERMKKQKAAKKRKKRQEIDVPFTTSTPKKTRVDNVES